MEIILGKKAGFCYGVKRAVEMAFSATENEKKSYSFGDLVHNEHVIDDLKKRGVQPIRGELPVQSQVISRSHGILKEEKEKILERGNTLIDCACPSVLRIHRLVEEKDKEGYALAIVGVADHPEVQAICSYAKESVVLEKIEDVPKILPYEKLLLVSQTTNKKETYEKIKERVLEVFTGEFLGYNTICNATRERQEETRAIAKEVDAMIVLGGKKSSNSRKLVDVARCYCENVFFLQSIDEIEIETFQKFNRIGITAGASTPDSVIKEAVSRMENLNKDDMNMEAMSTEMLEAIENSFNRVRRGDILEGEVLFVTDDEVMVNINYRADGIIARDELSNDGSVKPADMFKPGDKVQVYVLKMDDGDGNVVLSYKRVENMKVWEEMEKKYENKERVTALVKSVVKGGLTCEVDGLSGFIPASHASIRFQRDLEKYVGQELVCEIIDFEKGRRKFVLSRKNVEMDEVEEKRKEVYDSIHPGDVVEGTVQRLTDFGAFVDIGGVDGLVHISELAWNRVKHPSEVVQPGDHVKVQVLKVDEERNRIALGLKQTQERPWDRFKDEVKVGDVVKGKVVNLLDFGAFVRLESGVDGLLHVSQISREHVEKPSDKLTIGDEVEVKVTDINDDEMKISLSMKALTEDTQPRAPRREPRYHEEENYDDYTSYTTQKKSSDEDNFGMSIGDLLNSKDFND